MTNAFEIVGCSPKSPSKVCLVCDGDGKLAITDRAACEPDKFPDELKTCKACKGLGGVTAEDGVRGRAFWAAYREILFAEDG